MHIRSVKFIKSAVKPSQYPPADLPEIAFVGRSNVGKSSMINCLVQRQNLVKVSQVPGKTQLINFFEINESMRFVDLPGFGYAKVPKSVQRQWGPMIEGYFENRPNFCGVFLLIDIRRELRAEEENLVFWFLERGVPLVLVLTKADKLSRSAALNQHKKMMTFTGLKAENLILFSSKTKQGRESVWLCISQMTGLFSL